MQTQMYSNEDLIRQYGEDMTFSSLIKTLESNFWEEGQVICEIHIDGTYISESDEKVIADQPLKKVNSLELLTRRQDELVAVTLRTAIDWMPKLKQSSLALAETTRWNSEGGINSDQFVELLEGCHWLTESLQLLKPVVFNIVEKAEFEKKWERAELFLVTVAKEALKAFEIKDMVLMSDILEYDLTSSLDSWSSLLGDEEAVRQLIRL